MAEKQALRALRFTAALPGPLQHARPEDIGGGRPGLATIHERLDQAVLDAYGWSEGISDEELLKNLLALNLERAG